MRRATQEFIEKYLVSDEGELHQIYGKVKSGKTALGTTLALQELMKGQTVIANWEIFWNGYDEREHIWPLLKRLFGSSKPFLKIPVENFIYLDPTKPRNEILDRIARTTDAKLFLDEGHRYFDSYLRTSMDMDNREIALLTAHFNRTIVIITQRPTAIHVALRGNVNRFFKCEKSNPWFGLFGPKFHITEFQEMTNESPDETKPERDFSFYGSKNLFAQYNYKSMRGDTPRSQPNYAEAYALSWSEAWSKLWSKKIRGKFYAVPQIEGLSLTQAASVRETPPQGVISLPPRPKRLLPRVR